MNRFSADHTYTLNILRFCFACSRVTGSLLGWWKAGAKEHTVIVNEVENMWLVCWRFCAKRNKQHAIFTWKKKKKVKLNWIELNLYSRFARLLSQLVSECIQTNCTLAVGWFSHIFNVSAHWMIASMKNPKTPKNPSQTRTVSLHFPCWMCEFTNFAVGQRRFKNWIQNFFRCCWNDRFYF